MHLTRQILMTLAAVCLFAVAASAEEVTFPKQIPTGTVYTTMNMDSDQTMTGGPMGNMKMSTGMLMVMKMDSSKPDEAGNRTVKMKYERMVMVNRMGGEVMMKYDSANPDASQGMLANVFQPMMHSELILTVDKTGEIIEVKGLEEMFEKMSEGNPQMAEGFKQSFGKDQLAKMMNASRDFMPSEPVSVGDTWENDVDMNLPMLGEQKISSKMKLIDVSGKVATIDMTTTMSDEEADEIETPEGSPMKLEDFTVNQTGKSKINLETGLNEKTDINQKMTMTMSMQQGKESMTMKIDQDARIVMTQTRERDMEAENQAANKILQ